MLCQGLLYHQDMDFSSTWAPSPYNLKKTTYYSFVHDFPLFVDETSLFYTKTAKYKNVLKCCTNSVYFFLITVISITTAHQEELRMAEPSKEIIVHPAVCQALLDFGGGCCRNFPFVYPRKNLSVIGFELLQMSIIRPPG